jgi:transcriptional regulator with XRE-family HTH domain
MRLAEFLRLTATPQAKFAVQIGVRQATISRYVSGKIPPSAAVMARICDVSQGAVGPGDWAPEKKIRRPSIAQGRGQWP